MLYIESKTKSGRCRLGVSGIVSDWLHSTRLVRQFVSRWKLSRLSCSLFRSNQLLVKGAKFELPMTSYLTCFLCKNWCIHVVAITMQLTSLCSTYKRYSANRGSAKMLGIFPKRSPVFDVQHMDKRWIWTVHTLDKIIRLDGSLSRVQMN